MMISHQQVQNFFAESPHSVPSAEVVHHLASCPVCQQYVQTVRQLEGELKLGGQSQWPRVFTPKEQLAEKTAVIQQTVHRRRRRQEVKSAVQMLVGSIALVVLLFFWLTQVRTASQLKAIEWEDDATKTTLAAPVEETIDEETAVPQQQTTLPPKINTTVHLQYPNGGEELVPLTLVSHCDVAQYQQQAIRAPNVRVVEFCQRTQDGTLSLPVDRSSTAWLVYQNLGDTAVAFHMSHSADQQTTPGLLVEGVPLQCDPETVQQDFLEGSVDRDEFAIQVVYPGEFRLLPLTFTPMESLSADIKANIWLDVYLLEGVR